MKRNIKPTTKPSRRTHSLSILRSCLEQSHLIKFQRLLLEQSSAPNLVYSSDLLLDYPNPALDPSRTEVLDGKFAVDYLLHNLYRKLVIPGITPREELERAAYKSFFRGERNNIITNRRLRSIPMDDVHTRTLVYRIQKRVSHILGVPDYDKIVELSRFSSGATADLKLKDATLQQKYEFRNPSVTDAAIPWLYYLNREERALTGLRTFNIVDGNRVLTVPKSNSTDRTIAAEPTLNMFFQLGVGKYIRGRLRRAGINLQDQTINQEYARIGSIDGSLATLDLENASNSVSYEVVKLLLPPDWFEILDSLRSPIGTVKGRPHRYRMFSSMGNGYTFELETLLFYAICKTICREGVVSVYGDDIIVPTKYAEQVVSTLRFFGFNTNVNKSFIHGRFRESCGKHYHSGHDVSPFFVRRIPRKLDIFLLFNNLVRWMSRDGIDIRYVPACEFVLSLIPEDSRICGPDGYGDGHLLELEGVTSYKRIFVKNTYTFGFKSIVLTFDKKEASQIGALCASLLGCTKDNVMSYSLDGARKRYKVKLIAVQS